MHLDPAHKSVEHVDVLIVGAGLSGIGAGYHVQVGCPDKTYAIPEARDAIGGTWDLFRYPGIRSDSDMYTLGYAFKPWAAAQAIADGSSILSYVRETAAEYDIDRKILVHHRVLRPIGRRPMRGGRWRRDAGHCVPDLRLPLHVQWLLPLRRRLHARFQALRSTWG
jgi:monooxygenase